MAQTFEDICKQMAELHAKKNSDYGNAFAKNMEAFEEFGIITAASIILNKANRIASLAKSECRSSKSNFESLEDSLIDLANYCVMTLVERKKS